VDGNFDYMDLLTVMSMQFEMSSGTNTLINSCGSQFKLTPLSETSGVELILKLEEAKGNKRLYRFLTNFLSIGGEVKKSYDANVIIEGSDDETKFGVKVKVVRKEKGQPNYVVSHDNQKIIKKSCIVHLIFRHV
jgi:hypothetical protein